MIRQAISCDICGTDMQRSNHWFAAYDRGDELRLTSWDSRARLRSGAKHLCGQTCLHKLVDEFMVRTASTNSMAVPSELPVPRTMPAPRPVNVVDRSIPATPLPRASQSLDRSADQLHEVESSARLIASHPIPQTLPLPVVTEIPNYHSPNWQAAAWKRERERLGSAATAGTVSRTSA